MSISWKHFWNLVFESVNYGKISNERECLFCGSKLDQDRLEAARVRIGRLSFLLHSIESGSKTADTVLEEILTLSSNLTDYYLPEDDPDWWMEKGWKTYRESASG